jgi:hypothetical protein
MHRQPNQCPVCDGAFFISELTCEECGSVLKGKFGTSRFTRLDKEQARFLETFLRCRGVLSAIEKELGMSYPTVRSRLDSLLESLGFAPEPADKVEERAASRAEILDQLERGEITAEEAKAALRGAQ